MSIQNANFDIHWTTLPKGWARSEREGTPPMRVPYFLHGRACLDHRAGKAVEMTTSMLVKGMLHEWLAPVESWGVPERAGLWGFIRSYLDRYATREGYGSLSMLSLSLSAKVRDTHGHLPAMKMLMAGHCLVPSDAEIRSDLILDVWALSQATDDIDKPNAYGLIRALYDGIRFEEIGEDVCDELDYANFVALSYLGDYQRRNWLFWRVISKRIRHKRLKHKMIQLLNHPGSMSLRAESARPAQAL